MGPAGRPAVTIPGRGGLPARQAPYNPGQAQVSPGARNIVRARTVIIGPNGGLFLYAGQPAAGNPPVLWSVAPGTAADPYGNALPGGLNVFGAGNPAGPGTFIDDAGNITQIGAGNSQLSLMPAAALPFSLTSAFSGIMQTLISLGSGDSNQAQAGVLAGVTIGTGAAAKMGTLLTSPYGANAGMGVLLQAENDGGTDTASAMIGTVATQGGTLTFTPAAAVYPSAAVVYTGGGTVNVVTKNSGSGTIPIPAGAAATGYGQAWGVGGDGGGAGGFAAFGGGGAGGGGYGAEPSLAITPGGTVAYSVAAGHGAGAGDTTLTGSAVTVTAHPGADGATGASGSPGAGAAASSNTIAFPGGSGGQGLANGGGGGGGSSGGPAGAGGAGAPGRAHAGGAGGSGGSGAGHGGGGGGPGNNGSPGFAPGGGGGGGGVSGGSSGGVTGSAQVTLTYNTGTFTVLASMANAAFTDQFANAIKAGTSLPGPALITETAAPATPTGGGYVYVDTLGKLHYKGPGGTDTTLAPA